MAYFAALDGYLIVSGPTSREPDEFKLWFWSGLPMRRPGASRFQACRDWRAPKG